MVYQAVTEVISLFRRNDFPQCHFNFLRILDSIHKANPVGETNAVCISDNSWFTEYIAHDQIGQGGREERQSHMEHCHGIFHAGFSCMR